MRRPALVLMDANAIIEAVRTGCWAAITGSLRVETVRTCRTEVLSGSPVTIPGYVPVTETHLERMAAVRAVSDVTRATFKVAYAGADNMDRGEQDLFAHAYGMRHEDWVVCSPDKASVRAAVALELGERVRSLEEIAETVGARPNPPLRRQFSSQWLSSFRTRVLLEGGP